MFAPFKAMKKPIVVDTQLHRELRVMPPTNFEFAQALEVIPLGFSELLGVSMYYPVLFGIHRGQIFPFAVLGTNGRNIYLNEERRFKVDIIPNLILNYPFSVIKKENSEGEGEWLVILDESQCQEEGIRIFEESGEETSYFQEVKKKLTDLALDLQKALDFSQEVLQTQCLELIPELTFKSKYGSCVFKNALIVNIERLRKLSPEKLYFYHSNGYLSILYSIYLSVRNFKLWDLI